MQTILENSNFHFSRPLRRHDPCWGVLAGKLYFGGNSGIAFFDAYRHGNAWKATNQAILGTFIFAGKLCCLCEKKRVGSYCAKGEKNMLDRTVPRVKKNMLDRTVPRVKMT